MLTTECTEVTEEGHKRCAYARLISHRELKLVPANHWPDDTLVVSVPGNSVSSVSSMVSELKWLRTRLPLALARSS
jgi:hypothetical protein